VLPAAGNGNVLDLKVSERERPASRSDQRDLRLQRAYAEREQRRASYSTTVEPAQDLANSQPRRTEIRYEITVENDGCAPGTHLAVIDQLPNGVSLVFSTIAINGLPGLGDGSPLAIRSLTVSCTTGASNQCLNGQRNDSSIAIGAANK